MEGRWTCALCSSVITHLPRSARLEKVKLNARARLRTSEAESKPSGVREGKVRERKKRE